MTPARRATILADIASAGHPLAPEEWLNGYIAGLRAQGEMADAEVALAVRDKLKREGWQYREALPELNR